MEKFEENLGKFPYVTLADVATDPFLAFAMALADLVEPIYVASISWGSIEGDYHWVWWGVFVLCKVVKLGS